VTALTVIRTHDEIVARIKHFNEHDYEDFFGASRSELLSTLPFEVAQPFLKPEATAEEWKAMQDELTPVQDQAVTYLPFAIGKATSHRGLSANRSIDHFDSWIWLLCDDDTYNDWATLPYENYGAPKLRKAAELLNAPWPTEQRNAEINRMAQELPCRPGCGDGCGS
jgi:hypothetical protein